ncbi:MAG: c-type cytochrome [Pseudomonadota bacterium]
MSAPSSEKSSHPISTAVAIIGGSVAVIVGIVLLAHFAVGSYSARSLKDNPVMSDEAVAKRLKPIGEFVVSDANAPKVLKTGEQVFGAVCSGCHAAGVAGAPKFGDKAAWESRIATGFEQLVKNAINGVRAMPARGGNPDLSDTEVARAVAYMGNGAGANFKEPAAPADTAKAEKSAAPAASEAAQPAAVASAPAATSATPPAAADSNKGKSVFDSTCVACHGTGVAGAPKVGDKAAWAPRIAQGATTLHEHAIKGFQGKSGMMPAKGGNPSLPDADIAAAVDYMASQSK